MTTVKEIHNDFKAEVSQMITGSQYEALKTAGFNLAPPKEIAAAFPLSKLIHQNTIVKLCQKYNLVFARTSEYIGVIPPKNMQELDEFIKTHDYFHAQQTNFWGKSKDHLFVKSSDKHLYKKSDMEERVLRWMIVAPKEMIVSEKAKASAKIRTVQDPIIIAMIKEGYYGNTEWGVIVTAWGDEASDEAVVNEKMN